jgi:phosphoribosyl-ATP pyrophosphohydrolase
MNELQIMTELWDVIVTRVDHPSEDSYVSRLVHGPKGVDRSLEKVGEEATEFIIAVKNGSRQQIVSEAADLQFHFLIALKAAGIDFEEILAELRNRRK